LAADIFYHIDIDQFDNCPDLLVNLDIQFSEDGYDFESVGNLSGDQSWIENGIHNTAAAHIAEFAEEKSGFYRICSEIQKVEPDLYERPISTCSNSVRHKPECEYDINRFVQVSTRPSGDNSGYDHDFSFDGFQNKWCGDMLVTAQVTDPLGGVYEVSKQSVDGEALYFSVFQDDNFVNGRYSATLTWRELESAYFK